jgi:hypothetical protein
MLYIVQLANKRGLKKNMDITLHDLLQFTSMASLLKGPLVVRIVKISFSKHADTNVCPAVFRSLQYKHRNKNTNLKFKGKGKVVPLLN